MLCCPFHALAGQQGSFWLGTAGSTGNLVHQLGMDPGVYSWPMSLSEKEGEGPVILGHRQATTGQCRPHPLQGRAELCGKQLVHPFHGGEN